MKGPQGLEGPLKQTISSPVKPDSEAVQPEENPLAYLLKSWHMLELRLLYPEFFGPAIVRANHDFSKPPSGRSATIGTICAWQRLPLAQNDHGHWQRNIYRVLSVCIEFCSQVFNASMSASFSGSCFLLSKPNIESPSESVWHCNKGQT